VTTVKPFDAGDWFPIHTTVFDAIMPTLSPEAWKALCVAIRLTWGAADADAEERPKWRFIFDSQFRARMGGESQAAVSMALQECVEAGYLVQYEIEEEQGELVYVYALNYDLRLAAADGVQATDTEAIRITPPEMWEDEDDGDDGVTPADQFLIAAWRLATGKEITDDELDTLWELLGPDLAFGSLANVILELGRRVGNLTTEWVEAVVSGKVSITSLQDLEEESPPPELPPGPVVAATSTSETDPVLAGVIKMYESEIGLVTERTAQHLMALTEEHRDMDRWRAAFDAVVRSNVRRLDYLVTCLENVGKPKSKPPGRRGRGPRPESTVKEKPPAEDIDPETLARQKAAWAEWRKQREREQE
jgi:hypothetical protein